MLGLLLACTAPASDGAVDEAFDSAELRPGEPFGCAETTSTVTFADVGAAWGLHDTTSASPNRKEHSPVAFADLDGDGDDDVLLADRESGLWLHLNEGDRFDVALLAELPELTTLALADLDGDRDLDLVAGGKRRAIDLWINDAGTFTDAGAAWGLAGLGITRDLRDLAFGDYDGDGDADLYVVTANDGNTTDPNALHRLFRNDGRFVDVSALIPAEARSGLGWQAVWSDFTGNGELDLFLANAEQGMAGPSRLLRNLGGRFVDVTDTCACGNTGSNMGASAADLNADGWTDLFVTNTGPAVLLQNDAAGGFYDVAAAVGATAVPDVSWMTFGSAAFDLGNDGDVDVFTSTGPLYDQPGMGQVADQPDVLLEAQGGHYADVAAALGVADPGAGRGVATGDLDGDGFPELLVGVVGAPSRLYRSSCTRAGAVVVELDGPPSNRFGVGARVVVETDAGVRSQVVQTKPGWAAAAYPRAWFGLGEADGARVTVSWPDGAETTAEVVANSRVTLVWEE